MPFRRAGRAPLLMRARTERAFLPRISPTSDVLRMCGVAPDGLGSACRLGGLGPLPSAGGGKPTSRSKFQTARP